MFLGIPVEAIRDEMRERPEKNRRGALLRRAMCIKPCKN